jgi:PPOX class probable F420-dependent enzyme
MGDNQRKAITMTDVEIESFIDEQKTATLATIGPSGHPHLVAMWYAVINGTIWIETKTKSQKSRNILNDSRISLLIEDGDAYEELRGVSIEGKGVISNDPAELWQVGVDIYQRHFGEYSEKSRQQVEAMLNNRIAVRIDIERVRSWDHRKLEN